MSNGSAGWLTLVVYANFCFQLNYIIHSVRQSSSIAGALRGVDIDLTFQVSNAGNRIEELYKLEVHIHSKVLRANTQYKSRMRDEGAFTIFSFANTSPLFQGETTSLAKVVISLNSNNISLLLHPLTVNLYYSNGSKKRTFHIDNEIIVAGVAMKDWVWK
ncbi:hypothetical protein [Pedobacter sp.]|uniref:hypothetical protein n=1 Tax=Pedobacter sp. TaxID=1411316 RepID=UPI003BA8FDB0